MIDARDVDWTRHALALAQKGAYSVTPNPKVGAVIVKNDHAIGQGWHQKAGEPHAEIHALNDAIAQGHEVRGATMYVSLEPCNHFGRTPPCTQAIIDSGISRVVAAMRDPHPKAAHGGEVLSASGIAFDLCDDLADEARALNLGFISRVTKNRPFVRVKAAVSLDGRLAAANGKSQWITGAAARRDGHHFRAMACALLTGIGTVLADDPSLLVRDVDTTRQPLRIVLDTHGRMPRHAKVVTDGGKTLIITAAPNYPIPAHENIEVFTQNPPPHHHTIDLHALMRELAEREINELHVEAGSRINGALLEADLIDELLIYTAPSVLGQEGLPLFALSREGLETTQSRLDAFHRFHAVATYPLAPDICVRWQRKE
ncbi:MAG: bifunctional diaminohydroxyphosphoribosylaminopyrimidine deaminase/5-amino-6-(5-phosphoribosylamino)uracil reductase RibD [Burkholderiales bacterium]|jgi:diaminohydroxyphosphoribosylaminopyrimidine deaminase/5-amino-6-(5-phosphoribosylamino)uracil reductase|nr:bifunctional diaminohydroxyphosphoribosylaminopyrimidine deaminase/5-amino-6-(5-phosphoribosylamino)uracil reductase RibD [Burkholderiales bacterium]